MEKIYPKVGDGLYLAQRGKSSGCIREVKTPYTVISVNDDAIVIQSDECIFDPEDNYYCSLPIEIKPDKKGELVVLHWSDKIQDGCWWAYEKSVGRDYPLVAYFAGRQYYPYMD